MAKRRAPQPGRPPLLEDGPQYEIDQDRREDVEKQIGDGVVGGAVPPKTEINQVGEGDKRAVQIVPLALFFRKGPEGPAEELGQVVQILDEIILLDQPGVVPDELSPQRVGE